jgi:hypothetical protein
MRLIYTASGELVKVGDQVMVGAELYVVLYFREPHKPSSSGKATVSLVGYSQQSEYYVSVIGAEWVDREDRKITIYYESVDGFKKTAEFTDIRDARTYAQEWMGKHCDVTHNYAISGDGIGRIMVDGISLADLFEVKS